MINKKMKQPIEKGVCKVPVIMQLEALECGAACLCMVLAYYNKWIPLEVMREDCGVSRDGSRAHNIIRAARNYKLDAQGFTFEPEELEESGIFPCIIHWNFNHFVVLCGFKNGKAYINDPARGNIVVSKEEFDESFTGICLMFEPSEEFEMSGKPKNLFEFAKKRLVSSKKTILFVVVSTVIASLLGLISPIFTRIFIDELIIGGHIEWLKNFTILILIFSFVQIIVSWIQDVNLLKISLKMDAVGSSSYMWKLLKMPMRFFSQRTAGDLLSRKDSNSEISKDLIDIFAPLIINTIMMVFYFIVMVRYSVVLSLIGLLSVIINACLSQWISKKRMNIIRVRMRDLGKLSSSTVSGIEMIETIKASGAENGYFEKWSGYQASVNSQDIKFLKKEAYLGLLPQLVSAICDVLILSIGIYLTMIGEFTIGSIMAFQGIMESFADPADTLIASSQAFQEMRTRMERIDDIMEYPSESTYDIDPTTEDQEALKKIRGSIELKDVTFGYSSLDEPLIKNFNLSIKPGERIALVGMSGCGKSTISKLVSGLYHPWSGEILYDGKHLDEIDRNVFTGSISVVDQDIILFEDTIENNIKLWDKSIEDFEMILAARDAQIHEDIMLREGGYKYKIIEGGKDFSGGQRQRLEIARVLAQDPNVIILDEATSALDAKTEYDVVNAIRDRGITCIVVAHRLSTIRDCDEILVLDHGEVIERGTHDELMKLNGAYVNLVMSN